MADRSVRAVKKAQTNRINAKNTVPKPKRVPLLVPWPIVWGLVAISFLLGLICRIAALNVPPTQGSLELSASRWQSSEMLPFLENDEKIYIALVEQLDNNKGYTLHGHLILRESWINLQQYDHPIFFHPPGGLFFFWLTYRIWSTAGFAMAQVLSYGIFYWSMIALQAVVFRRAKLAAVLTAVLAAFSPIMTHVTGRFWLDGPLLAFTTLASVVFLYGVCRKSLALVCVAGFLLGYASLIKLTAFLVVPGLAAMTAVLLPEFRDLRLFKEYGWVLWRFIVFVAVAVAIQVPWEIWQWWAVGSPFPSWAGKPAADLVRTNPYVYYLTNWREPLVYLELLPQVVWTFVPSILLMAFQWNNRELRLKSMALLVWIVAVVAAHMVLGFIGYSKLLRYVILVTPATIMLFVLVTVGWIEGIWENQVRPGGKPLAVAGLLLAAIALGFEIMQGIVTPLYHNADLIKPLPGLRTIDYGQPMPWPPP